MTGNPPKVVFKSSYRALLGEAAWHKLHPAIQQRFSDAHCNKPVTYVGMMTEVFASFWGRVFAQVCRLIGTPLALNGGKNIATRVCVYPNEKLQGLTWDRYYYFPYGGTNRVRSTKCIRSDLGLVEVVGCGFGMRLNLCEREGALVFESTGYYVQVGKLKIAIPALITPGNTVVSQKALDERRFLFSLDVVHPLLGRLFHQHGIFEEALQ